MEPGYLAPGPTLCKLGCSPSGIDGHRPAADDLASPLPQFTPRILPGSLRGLRHLADQDAPPLVSSPVKWTNSAHPMGLISIRILALSSALTFRQICTETFLESLAILPRVSRVQMITSRQLQAAAPCPGAWKTPTALLFSRDTGEETDAPGTDATDLGPWSWTRSGQDSHRTHMPSVPPAPPARG